MQETFRVADISCDHCKRAIEQALQPVGGVRRAEVNVPEKSVTVEWEPESVGRDRLIAEIEGAGYSIAG